MGTKKLTVLHKTPLGFTLVELLVAIVVVAIIGGVIIVSAAAAQKQARDGQRKSDLRKIQTALQQYYTDQGYFPLTSNFNLSTATSLKNPAGTVTYLQNVPKEPQSAGSDYCYRGQVDDTTVCTDNNDPAKKCNSYFICATLENPATPTSCGCGGNYYLRPNGVSE